MDYEITAKVGQEYKVGTWSGVSICSVLVSGESGEQVKGRIDDIAMYFYKNSEWKMELVTT